MILRVLIPPAVVGASLSIAAAVTVGLLLYGGMGFLRALASIVATLLVALGMGLWFGRAGRERDPVERARRLWLLTLLSFTLAVLYSGAWELLGDLPAGSLRQALGLALLGGLPLFFGGSLLGAMGRVDSSLLPAPGSRRPGPSTVALAGAAGGVLLGGVVFFPSLSATAMLLLCVVGLSAAALLHGWILDSGFLPRVAAARESPDGEVRIVEEVRGRPRALRRLAFLDGRIRGAEDEEGGPVRPVERELAQWLPSRCGDGWRVLFLGAGVCTLPRALADARPDLEVVALEESPLLVEVGRERFSLGRATTSPASRSSEGSRYDRTAPPGNPATGFGTEGAKGAEHGAPDANRLDHGSSRRRPEIHTGEWTSLAPSLAARPFDLVAVDLSAIFPVAPGSRLATGGLDRLRSLLGPGGTLVLTGVSDPREGGTGTVVEAIAEAARPHFTRADLHRTPADPSTDDGSRTTLARDRHDFLVLPRNEATPEASSPGSEPDLAVEEGAPGDGGGGGGEERPAGRRWGGERGAPGAGDPPAGTDEE